MIFRFTKTMRLRSRRDYKRIGWHYTRHQGNFVSIDEKQNHLQSTRLGITVTKKYGDAHLRNRFKRLVREAFRLAYPTLRIGVDLNVRPKKAALKAVMKDIQADLVRFLQLPNSI